MEKCLIQAGQKFRFAKPQEAIWLNSPSGNGLGYQVPAERARATYKQDLLTDQIAISEQDVFWAECAYWSAMDLWIVRFVNVANGQLLSFQQAERGAHAVSLLKAELVPEVHIVDASITEELVVGQRSFRVRPY